MTVYQLSAFAECLRSEGFRAEHVQVEKVNLNGIQICNDDGSEDFFSLRELNDNADLLASRDFAGIKARRPA